MKGPRDYETPVSAMARTEAFSAMRFDNLQIPGSRSFAQPLTVAVGTVSCSRLKVVQLVFRIYTTTS